MFLDPILVGVLFLFSSLVNGFEAEEVKWGLFSIKPEGLKQQFTSRAFSKQKSVTASERDLVVRVFLAGPLRVSSLIY